VLKDRIQSLVDTGRLAPDDAAALLAPPSCPVAVVGAALRVPGASSLDELWQRLLARHDAIRPFPVDRFRLVVDASPTLAAEHGAARSTLDTDPDLLGSWLTGIEQFDPEAFGLTAMEARFMGPAERLFLSTAHEALAAAGHPRQSLRGTRTGVFVGYTPEPPMDYLRLFDDPDERAFIANIPANLGYHLAYLHDLRGPVLTVNTTCSSSLSAVHLAKAALERGECDLVVVAGVSLNLCPLWNTAPDHVVRSPHNRCAPFDAAADGIIYGEGVITVVLQRLDDATAHRNHVHAVITGSAMNSDGASNGVQAPNPDAQAQVVRDALAAAGVTTDQIGYVEAHGTGTKLGDLAEVDGLTKAFQQDTAATGFCRLGSIKANIGHLGDSAGLAGLVAAMLCLRHSEFPGLGQLREPNPLIGFEQTPFTVGAERALWPQPVDGVRRAGVSSFGISGTNVHLVLEESLSGDRPARSDEPLPVLLSAGSRWALWELVDQLADWTARTDQPIEDIAYTLGCRREHGPVRIAVTAASTTELAAKLGRLLQLRTFERLPHRLFEDGIAVADCDENRELSLARLHAPEHDLIRRFAAGADVTALCAQLVPTARMVDAPIAPLTTRRIWPGSDDLATADVSDLFFDIDWERQSPAASDREALIPGSTWVVFTRPNDPVLAAVARELSAQGVRAELVAVGGPDSGAQHWMPAMELAALRDLWARLIGVAGIVHGVTCRPPDDTMDSLDSLDRSQRDGVLSLFHLAQSLLDGEPVAPLRLAVVTSASERVVPDEPVVPARVTAFGLAKVLSQECPSITDLAIDHDLAGAPAEIARQIVDELGAATRLPLVAYRDGTRFTKVVSRRQDRQDHEIPVRSDGTYVLAGGTGYLGMQVGRYLADRGVRRIVLLSRTGLPDDDYTRESVAHMRGRGADVVWLCCDLTVPGSVAAAFAEIRRLSGRVDGAFMLTKQLYHLWLGELDAEQFTAAIDNRVRGAWLLHRELLADRPDFLVLFSSISSLMGTKGAAECCAVNQYLDAAPPLFTERGVPTYTLNLTLVLDDKGEFGSRTAIPPIEFVDFRSALDRFLRQGDAIDLVARLDLAEVSYLRPVLRIPFDDALWREAELAAPVTPETDTAEVVDRDEVRAQLHEVWRATLGQEPEDGIGFFSAGGTSLSALRFVHLVRKKFAGVSFDVADLYAHPTIEALVDRLVGAPDEPVPAEPGLDSILDSVQSGQLSQADATRLLEKSLREAW
jgi:3-oxoacyl-(acyl-carrier-protein) synthase